MGFCQFSDVNPVVQRMFESHRDYLLSEKKSRLVSSARFADRYVKILMSQRRSHPCDACQHEEHVLKSNYGNQDQRSQFRMKTLVALKNVMYKHAAKNNVIHSHLDRIHRQSSFNQGNYDNCSRVCWILEPRLFGWKFYSSGESIPPQKLFLAEGYSLFVFETCASYEFRSVKGFEGQRSTHQTRRAHKCKLKETLVRNSLSTFLVRRFRRNAGTNQISEATYPHDNKMSLNHDEIRSELFSRSTHIPEHHAC
ncbi:hypothetical protein CLF_102059 [Clonorchis sinensis]|uniref:Uncharacterized protein n=1 Tax=Clonorchis sinensis TaxID=79923 RepID=G7Y771_CLOSI|nr:hypothetical protein CLF_102059 [Clonorchis sinensis]